MAGGLRFLNDRQQRQQWMANHPGPVSNNNPAPTQDAPSAPTTPQFQQVGGFNVPTYPAPQQVVQPEMPGQIDRIAQQLGFGGFGNPSELANHMRQFYKPMSMPNYGATPLPQQPSPGMPVTPPSGAAPQQPQQQRPAGPTWRDIYAGGARR